MNKTPSSTCNRRIRYIRAQGYFHLTDEQIASLSFGNRFAYILCASLLATGVATAHIPTLAVMGMIAFGTIILPYHPFDYLYNYLIRHWLHKPELPPRSKQLKFACTIASLWIAACIYLFYTGMAVAGYIMGGLLVSVAFILVTTDFCIPSMIYNIIFSDKSVETEQQCQ